MIFETLDDRVFEKSTFEKINYFYLDYGTHRVRLLTDPVRVWTHFLRGKGGTKGIGVTVKCLGTDCPICQNNKVIKMSNPEEFRKVSGYNASAPRYYMNVLDRTTAKICPQCQTENKQDIAGNYPAMCKSCQTLITDIEPASIDKVKMINLSDTIIGELKLINSSNRDESGEAIGCENYDIVISVTKAGGKKNIFIQADVKANDKVEIDPEHFYSVEKSVISLTADEMIAVVNGVSLKDIYAARRGTSTLDETLDENLKEVEESVAQLFGN